MTTLKYSRNRALKWDGRILTPRHLNWIWNSLASRSGTGSRSLTGLFLISCSVTAKTPRSKAQICEETTPDKTRSTELSAGKIQDGLAQVRISPKSGAEKSSKWFAKPDACAIKVGCLAHISPCMWNESRKECCAHTTMERSREPIILLSQQIELWHICSVAAVEPTELALYGCASAVIPIEISSHMHGDIFASYRLTFGHWESVWQIVSVEKCFS